MVRFRKSKQRDEVAPTATAGDDAGSQNANDDAAGAGPSPKEGPAPREGPAPKEDSVLSEQDRPIVDTGAQSPVTGEQQVEVAEDRDRLGQIDRKLATRTYAGAALAILALAAGIVAVVLAIDARDNSATNAELDQVQEQLGGVAAQASDDSTQRSVDALSERVDSLSGEIDAASSGEKNIDQRLSVVEDDIEELRNDISDLDSGSGSGGGSGGN